MHARPHHRGSWFTRFAKAASRAAGHPSTFCFAVAIIVIWAVSGPFFGFSDTWQLVINTGTTIITFLMVFLIQNTQNRDSQAIQVKLDELIRSIEGAHLALLDLEELDDADFERICSDYRELAKQARKDLRAGKSDTDVREVGSEHRQQVSEKRRRARPPGKNTRRSPPDDATD
ncbi:MAG TPA: low affinity iron permease family protein [Steroidobacteraceae bacterium]|nr:low affinity iron permease family protein [Steroidobacteraceae bacterium]